MLCNILHINFVIIIIIMCTHHITKEGRKLQITETIGTEKKRAAAPGTSDHDNDKEKKRDEVGRL